ncbi:leucine-rich repeat-containing serine/threonine-protein kinase [Luteolibacter arcticus]|uniref:Leucine-rich repeat-containing serine/threonine-protein kinase n=1 Tax=Luteolibacter arcticus TaxID=1581411 RepID=A0ABT3GN43_9BACT|nr:leucine-rich repeat-containing protein kinase family protein [Luteolibacter arcticus]MCW1924938.1 leucine-rich repeat-containing serine/threonine-protein kinase [Luteolibacter arcticus]
MSADTLTLLRAGKLDGTRRLDLSCGLTDFPREIFDLAESLEILNLTGNRLSDLPADLPRLKKLRILFCSENDFHHLPPVLAECAGLSMLGFKSNRIERVEALPPSLRWLILTDNRIAAIPPSIGNCQPLQKLMLSGNRLESLPDEMAACTNLELVRLAANRFRSLPDWLFRMPKLAWLAFAGNPFVEEPTAAAAEIAWADLALEEKLGEGASGVIHRAVQLSSGRPVAVKIFKGAMTSDGLPASEMAAYLAAGGHSNAIPILGKIGGHPDQAQGLVMEWIDLDFTSLAGPPSLESCTRDVYPMEASYPLPVVIRIARGMASVAMMLHSKGIMHGDFYAHNVLRNAEGSCLLGDFGAASFHSGLPGLEQIEVRAFGCLLQELLDRCESDCGGLRELQQRCLLEDVRARPSFVTILRELDDFA